MSNIRNTQPLTARSVIASTLLGMHPPRMPTRLLVRTGVLFGISEGTTRVAISRMAAGGELEAEGTGYRLAGPLLARQSRQDTSRRADRRSWDGSWELAVVGDRARHASDRIELREAMRRLQHGELREGTWTRPANLDPDRLPTEAAVVAAQCERFDAVPHRPPAELAAELWDLSAWSDGGRRLIAELRTWEQRLRSGDTEAIAPSFVVSAGVLRHLLADPLLPDELLPPGWPGGELRATYDGANEAFTHLFGDWLHAQA